MTSDGSGEHREEEDPGMGEEPAQQVQHLDDQRYQGLRVGVVDVVSANLNDNVPVYAGSRGLGEHGVLAPDGLRPLLHPPPAATHI